MNNQLIRGNLFLFSKRSLSQNSLKRVSCFSLIRQERLKVYLLFCG